MPSVLPVPLHVNSSHSPLWGVRSPTDVVARAVRLGYDTLAITDRNGLYGLHILIEESRTAPIRAVVGAEIYKNEDRALCWVRSPEGWRNLCRLLSERHCDPGFDLVGALALRRQGLVVATDRPRVLTRLLREGRDDLYVEVSPGHAMHRALALARKRGVPPVATVRAVGFDVDDLAVHRVLRAVAGRTTVGRLPPGATAADGDLLVGPRALLDRFPHCPDAVVNTRRIAERCRWEGPGHGVVFPRYRGLSDDGAFRLLERRARAGAEGRYGGLPSEVEIRLGRELRIIRNKGFAAYFLVVADIVAGSERSCGRGSAAASLVAYALGITGVDPIRHNLFFERFLNEGRTDPPDIDVDFPWDERDEVLDRVFQTYGARRVAMVSNHVGFGWRSAVREAARAHGLSEGSIKSCIEKIKFHKMEGHGFEQIRDDPALQGKPWPEVLGAVARMSGQLRHLSVHCGGVVIAPNDIRDHVPVEVSAKGVPVIQWEKDQAEASGLVKIDLLGNRSLAVIRDAVEALEGAGQTPGPGFDDPSDDPATLDLVRRGDTMGCFYVESPATRLLLQRMWGLRRYSGWDRKDVFEHLVMASSIIRPAANRFIREFVARMRGASWETLHPLLRPVLDETYGIAIYQEQVTRIAMALAGFTPREGDDLRKVLSKKHREQRLVDLRERFFAGARGRGVPNGVVEAVWGQILSFAGYSFCKPHSASYAMVSMQCAWLKAHHPAEFLAAVLSNRGGYYTPFAYLSEARRRGLRVAPPCVNRSRVAYVGTGAGLRVGLLELKGLGSEEARELVETRERGGSYRDLGDFLRRSGVGNESARILGRAGALDGLAGGCNRASVLYDIDGYLANRAPKRIPELFEDSEPEDFVPRPPSPGQLRRWEWDVLGFPVTFHPLDPWREAIERAKRAPGPPLVPGGRLGRHAGRRVRMVGWWVTGKVVRSAAGDPMEFVSFEDTTAVYEATLFPDVYRRVCRRLTPVRPYLLEGRVEEEFGVCTLTLERVGFLDGEKSSWA